MDLKHLPGVLMQAEILSIGNELLNGNTVNTNATFMAKKLHEIGIDVHWEQSLRDDPLAIQNALQTAVSRSRVILITGGLGPTHDDITKKVVADFLNSKLVFHEDIFQEVRARFARRGIPMPEVNRGQALLPEDAELIPNPLGTARGMLFKRETGYIFVLPGVPREMQKMMENSVIPRLRRECPDCQVKVDLFRTTGIAESAIFEKIERYLPEYQTYEIAFLPKPTGVDMRIVRHREDVENIKKFEKFKKMLYNQIGVFIYTNQDQDLEAVVGHLLRERQLTLAVAESVTGGLVQDKITSISGSSDYFMGGMVAYSNQAKIKFLKVSPDTLAKNGAVSEAVASQMAAGVREVFQTDLGIATTGIAGPTGATESKPLGLTYIGVAFEKKIQTRKFQFGTDRETNKIRAAQAALDLIRRLLLKLNN